MELKALKLLKNSKNLLAFSYGSDSTALFFLLEEANIAFDLALVNYKSRASSDEEEKAALKLAKKYKKNIFVKNARLAKNNFEKKAREVRYKFFEEIIEKKGYDNLVLAHNLNDNFEWLLMQLFKGCGLFELLGMQAVVKRPKYSLIRPLIKSSKEEIKKYLEKKELFYFLDQSNENLSFLRNTIRAKYANEMVKEYEKGLKKSLSYLAKDKAKLYENKLFRYKNFFITHKDDSLFAYAAKELGVLLSSKQREQALQKDGIFSSKIGICSFHDFYLVFLYERVAKIPKKTREEYRKARIPSLIRAMFFKQNINIADFLSFIKSL